MVPPVVVVVVAGLIGLVSAMGSFQVFPVVPPTSSLTGTAPQVPGAGRFDRGILNGSWRAAFEQDFDDSLATTQVFRTLWHQLSYLLFAQTLPGVQIGNSDYLFTSEEWYENIKDFKFRPAFLRDTGQTDSIHTVPDDTDYLSAVVLASDFLEKAGMELVVALVPAKNRILGKFSKLPLGDRLSSRYQDTLWQLSNAGIMAVDLEAAFLKHPHMESLYMRTDTHWSPEGARTAAQAVASFISEHGNPGSAMTVRFYSQFGETEVFRGDLYDFLPVPSKSGSGRSQVRFGPFFRDLPKPEMLTRYSTFPVTEVSSSAGLFDTPRIPIALTGTSYSAGVDWNFAGFLMEAMHAELVNLSQAGVGPFEPMAALLGDPLLQELGVELVVWEIPERYLLP